jgi:hypothetical protein
MVYLIAVNHSVQYNRGSQQTKKFIVYLMEKIRSLNITFIAEEWSNDASKTWKVATSTVEDLAQELNIQYEACDPDRKERNRLEIGDEETDENFSKRESYWYEKVRDKINRHTILLICGSKHVSIFNPTRPGQGFDLLLVKNVCGVQVLPERFDDERDEDGVVCLHSPQ